MAVYMVDPDLPRITPDSLVELQEAANSAVRRLSSVG